MDGDGANKKRSTERQLTRENYKDDEGHGHEGQGEFARASEEELKTRQIRRARRAPTTAASTGGQNPFAGISLTASTPTPTTEEVLTPGATTVDETEEKEELQPIPFTPEKQEGEGDDVTAESGKGLEPVSLFGSAASLFGTPSTVEQAASSPVVDLSRFKPLEAITSGEESEETVYCEKAGLFVSSKGSWKAAGRGEVKLNLSPEGEARLIMRQDVTLKLLLNARLYPEINVKPMGEDAVSFACQNNVAQLDKGEGNPDTQPVYDILALRFKVEPKKNVESLIAMIEQHKSGKKKDDAA